MADDESPADRTTDDACYLSAAEPPTPNTRLVALRPLVRLDDNEAATLRAGQLDAEFPNQGRVIWSRPAVDPQTGTLWWHRVRPNPGFIGSLSGSNRWLVDETVGPASSARGGGSASSGGPTEAIEVLDLCAQFATDDRRVRHAFVEEGIALAWQPTRRVYLRLDVDAPGTWIGPIELVPRATAAGGVRWRLDPAAARADVLHFPCHQAAPEMQLMRTRLDGQERCFLTPDARPGAALPDWIWPADDAALDWLAQQLTGMAAADGAEQWQAVRSFVEQLARRVERLPEAADTEWLAWVDRALGRLDFQDRALEAVVLRLLDTPAVASIRPPAPDAQDPEVLRAEGYQAGRADAERMSREAGEAARRAAAEATATIERLRQLISEERAELDQANLMAQREATRRREAERQRDAANAELAAAQSRESAAQAEATAAQAAAETSRDQLAAAQEEIVALQGRLAEAPAPATVIERTIDPTGLTEMLALAQQQTAEAYAERARLQEELAALHTEAERLTLLALEVDDTAVGAVDWERQQGQPRAGAAGASEPLARDIAQLREDVHQLVDLVQTFGSFGGPVVPGPADRVAAWTPPWAGRPAPQPILAASVVQELRTAFRDAGLPGALARPLWRSLQTGRLPVLAGDGAREALGVLADLCFGGRRLPLEVDPGLLAPADLLGTLQDGRLRPSASRLADLVMQQAAGLAGADDASTDGPALLALYGLTRAPVDAYLLPLLAHYVRPAWAGRPAEPLGPLLPAALDASDPYAGLATLAWPRGLLLAGTIAEGTATIPPPGEFWAWATFHCLDHQGSTLVGGGVLTGADLPVGDGGAYGYGADISDAPADSLAGGAAVAVQRACTTVTVHDLFSGTPGGDGASAQEIEQLGGLFQAAGAPLPSNIVRAATELAARGFGPTSLLGSVLLPWAVTVGVARSELAGLLESARSPAATSDDQSGAADRLLACLGCMERLLR